MRRIVFLLTFLATPLLAATRLPQTVIPSHYTIGITPDLAGASFTGEEAIDVDVKEPVDSITLHAVDLALKEVLVNGEAPAATTPDAPNETITLKLPQTLAPGHATIRFFFVGNLSQQLRGLYLSQTAKRRYAVTQFEAMSARRAFPCFDEPAMKATFDITLIVANGDTAISNGAIVSDTPIGAGLHAIRFATTKRLPTYLVAMLVGDFQCISGEADGVPIRVCTTPGLQQLGHFALDAAQASVSFFDRYYGIKYPFGKLDLIGIPDFAAGAMENAAAITFRETDLLVDEKSASALVEKRVAEVVAHEIAHQWFGDLVTMKWWDDIWLNEGFATFMSQKPIEAWKPEWRTDLDKPASTLEAMTTDSQQSTQPIRSPANAEGGGFSNAGIIYGKTAAVLRMVEDWIGPDAFRDAIRVYLNKYAWGNAAAEDFWGTMKAATQQPVDTVLRSFIDRTGVPLLHIAQTCGGSGGKLTIAQERLLPRGDIVPPGSWTMPVCARGEACRVIAESPEEVAVFAPCDKPLFLSRHGAGYFVVDYPAEERASFRAHLGDLTPAEQIAYHGNEWILVRTMHLDAGEYLGLLRSMPRSAARPLVTSIADNLVYLGQRLVNDNNRTAWQAFVHKALRGYAPAAWETPAGETSEQRIERASVLWALGYFGDAQVIAGARRVAAAYMKDPASVDALIAERGLRLAAVAGDEAYFNRVVEHLESAPTPEIANRYRGLLPLFRDPKMISRAIEYIYSDKVRSQDLPFVASAMLTDPSTRVAAWGAAKARWADIEKKTPAAVGRIAAGTASFCDPDSRKDVDEFLNAHPVRGGQRARTRALESIDTCIAFRNAQQASFDAALGGKL